VSTVEYRQLLDWWTAELTPLPPPLRLPADLGRAGRPAAQAGPAAHDGVVRFDWGADLAGELTQFVWTQHTRRLDVLLAAYVAVLGYQVWTVHAERVFDARVARFLAVSRDA